MDIEQPSAQAQDTNTPPESGGGIQARIDELTAKMRQAQEMNQKLQEELLKKATNESEMARQMAELSTRQHLAQQSVAAPVDPLAAYREQLDPVALKAIESVTASLNQRFEAQLASVQQKYAVDSAALAVRSEVAAVPNLPPEVAQRAEQLMQDWRRQNWNVPTAQDAIAIALGQYQMGQLRKAAPVLQYQTNQARPAVTPGYAAPPVPKPALPSNFETLSREQQNNLLEQMGVADEPF